MTLDGKITRVGVLALQGAFLEHVKHIEKAFDELNGKGKGPLSVIQVRTCQELSTCDALIIPGGESTTMSLIAERNGLLNPLKDYVKSGKYPIWGTCAGLILLSQSAAAATATPNQQLIGGLDIIVERNHFGRQTESFSCSLDLDFIKDPHIPLDSVFIRAPIVKEILDPQSVNIIASLPHDDSVIVAVRQNHIFATAFHPELTPDTRLHEWWLSEFVL